MKTIIYLLQKEFTQIFRNRIMVPILLVMPFVQLIVLSYAANFEIKNIKIHIIDHDYSATSRRLLSHLNGSEYFIVNSHSFDSRVGAQKLQTDQADMVINIPNNFEHDLIKYDQADLQVLINAINGTKAGLANGYFNALLQDFNQNIRLEWPQENTKAHPYSISVSSRYWFNPELNYKWYMVPGILVLLVTMISVFLSSINIVREKEIGTIEQINVTTISKYQFIIGKLLPFWILAIVELSLGLLLAKYFFKVPFEGSLLLIFAFANIYILVVLGIGMFISTFSNTQQQAMFFAWFLMVIFILMSGLFTPIEYMPEWAQWITRLNPVAYFVSFMRMVLLKGSSFSDVKHFFLIIAIYATFINALAIWNYKKTTN